MVLSLSRSTLREWKAGDLASLVEQANNHKIWLNLRDRFPYPYTRRDGVEFIRAARAGQPDTLFAIEVDGRAVGGIDFVPRPDVERVSAEIGYWLGESYWGRGIATEAVSAVTALAVERQGLTRVFALPFAHNHPSCRVLEKCGYVLEARLRRSAIKDGVIVDQMQYAWLVP